MKRWGFQTTGISPSKCPYCGLKHDFASNMTGGPPPTPGDYSVCIGCGCFLEFDDDMLVQKPHAGKMMRVFGENPVFHKTMLRLQEVTRALPIKAKRRKRK